MGGRIGSGVQAVGQRNFANGNYLELRLGMDWLDSHGVGVDVSITHNWNVAAMNLTDEGVWFVDLGVGLDVGGSSATNLGFTTRYTWVGVQGVAKFGYSFENVPISLAFDWSPVFGMGISYWPNDADWGGVGRSKNHTTKFRGSGMGNFGLSCVYSF